MYDFVSTPLGWFHLTTSCIAMLAGGFVLLSKKGTKIHKNIGYLYVVMMILVCGSALGIYKLTGAFGMFHVLAFLGFATLMAGMSPILFKSLRKKYGVYHLWFMYYSVLGLYAAFASELSVRIPEKPFFLMVGVATAVIFLGGSIFIFRKQTDWNKFFPER